jgi:hypothetical protein
VPAALDHQVRSVADRHALRRQGARAAGTAAPFELGGIALDDADLVERNAKAVVDQLRVGGLVALTVRLRADHDADRAVVLERDLGRLLRVAHGRFDVVGHADAAPQPPRRRISLALGEAAPVGPV